MTDSAQAWAEAFTKAQSEFPHITKDKTVNTGTFSYKYADLGTVLDAVAPVLHANGLSVGQSAVSENGSIGVETRIYHKLGHVESFGPLFLPGGGDAKAAGSAVTYAKRYSLCAALGISTDEDDDGAAASKPSTTPKAQPVAEGEPYCPACLHINGEKVGVWQNDKKPFWKCKNKPEDCAGAEPDKDGKLWSWSGWDESFERSAQGWLDNHPEFGEQVEVEQPEVSPKDWLKARVGIFAKWTDEQTRDAAKAVMAELAHTNPLSQAQAQEVFDGMATTYWTEHPDDPGAPF